MTRRRDERRGGDNSEGREGRKGGLTRRRDDATTRRGFLVSWFWGASGGLVSGWFRALGFCTGAVGVISVIKIHCRLRFKIDKTAPLVASLRRRVDPLFQGPVRGQQRRARRARRGEMNTTTRRRNDQTGIFGVLVLGCEWRLRPGIAWRAWVFFGLKLKDHPSAENPLPAQMKY